MEGRGQGLLLLGGDPAEDRAVGGGGSELAFIETGELGA
jgi:hypothetical protein